MSDQGSGTILLVGPSEPADRADLEHRGHPVLTCAGPGDGTCPLVEGHGCRLVDEAAGIVFSLDPADSYDGEILRCYREEVPGTRPIHVTTGPEAASPQDRARSLSRFSDRVALASMARQALYDLVSASRRPAPGHPGIG